MSSSVCVFLSASLIMMGISSIRILMDASKSMSIVCFHSSRMFILLQQVEICELFSCSLFDNGPHTQMPHASTLRRSLLEINTQITGLVYHITSGNNGLLSLSAYSYWCKNPIYQGDDTIHLQFFNIISMNFI